MTNEKGQFIETTRSTRYKKVQYLGKTMQEHQRNFCISLEIVNIPKGFIIHHIDGNKKNNDINNLCLMTITAHNRIHFKNGSIVRGKNDNYVPWNKGLNTSNSEKWNETIKKAIKSRKGNYVAIKGKEVYDLKLTGITLISVAKQLGIARETAGKRLTAYLNYHKLIHPEETKRIDKFNKIKELRYSKGLSWDEVGTLMGDKGHLLRKFYKIFINNNSINV